jgi:hypothetical protein
MTKSMSKGIRNHGLNLISDENYSFTPEIDKKSKEIYKQKFLIKFNHQILKPGEKRNLRINEMYDRAKYRKIIIKKLDQQIYGSYSFIPNFNTNYVVESTFDERLDYFKNKSKEKKKQLEIEMKSKLESQNGKRFFTPTLISRQITRENQKHTDVYDYLYSFAKKFDSKKIQRHETEMKKILENTSSIHTTYDSEIMLNKLKQQNYEKIFILLDSDQDNLISKFCIDLKKLPEEIRNILKIITKEIIEDDQTLNKEEFMLACEQLYQVIKTKIFNFLINSYALVMPIIN